MVGTKNIHCGIPAADLEQSREVTDSLSGQCLYVPPLPIIILSLEKGSVLVMMDLAVRIAVPE